MRTLLFSARLATVPTNGSILTKTTFPHVANSVNAYVIPFIHLNMCVSELAISLPTRLWRLVEYILVDNATDELSTSFALLLHDNRSDFYPKEARHKGTTASLSTQIECPTIRQEDGQFFVLIFHHELRLLD